MSVKTMKGEHLAIKATDGTTVGWITSIKAQEGHLYAIEGVIQDQDTAVEILKELGY